MRIKKPLVSIIVTTKNEEQVLGRLLSSIKTQTSEDWEIIIVDNNSADRTKQIALKYTRHVYNKGPERSAQRNFGAKTGKGKYLFFLDADMELSKEVIKECLIIVEKNNKIGAVVIPEKSIAHTFWEKVKAFERSFYNLEGDEKVDAARFFSKDAFDKVGGYDETITGPEDWDLPDSIGKSGYMIERIKSIIYHHERINSPFSVARKKYYYALKSHRYLKKQKISTFGPKTVYFLRPIFYREWKRILTHPVLSLGMFLVLSLELVYGGVGFFIGKFTNK